MSIISYKYLVDLIASNVPYSGEFLKRVDLSKNAKINSVKNLFFTSVLCVPLSIHQKKKKKRNAEISCLFFFLFA